MGCGVEDLTDEQLRQVRRSWSQYTSKRRAGGGCFSDPRARPNQRLLRCRTPGRHPRGIHVLGTTGKRLWHGPVMRLPSACDSRKVTGRVSGIATTGEQDCDLRLLLSKLFRRCRLPNERADRSLRARQRDHSDAQSVALGTWQHANADNLKGSFACRCYGCTGAGRLFAGKSSPMSGAT